MGPFTLKSSLFLPVLRLASPGPHFPQPWTPQSGILEKQNASLFCPLTCPAHWRRILGLKIITKRPAFTELSWGPALCPRQVYPNCPSPTCRPLPHRSLGLWVQRHPSLLQVTSSCRTERRTAVTAPPPSRMQTLGSSVPMAPVSSWCVKEPVQALSFQLRARIYSA